MNTVWWQQTSSWQSKCIDFLRLLAGLGVGSHDSEASFKTDSKMASLGQPRPLVEAARPGWSKCSHTQPNIPTLISPRRHSYSTHQLKHAIAMINTLINPDSKEFLPRSYHYLLPVVDVDRDRHSCPLQSWSPSQMTSWFSSSFSYSSLQLQSPPKIWNSLTAILIN